MGIHTLKQASKQVMHGHWTKGIVACIMTGGMYLTLAACEIVARIALRQPVAHLGEGTQAFAGWITPGLFSLSITAAVVLLRFFLLTPLQYEKKAYFWQTQLCDAHHPQSKIPLLQLSYGKILKTKWKTVLRIVGWGTLFFLPGLGVMTAATWAASYSGWPHTILMALWIGSFLLLAAAPVGLAIVALRYWMAPYLLASCPKLHPSAAIRLSIQLMRGNKGKVLLLTLSLAGWFLLKMLVIPGIYAAPRIEMAYARLAVMIRQPADVKQPVPLSATQEFVWREKKA